MTRHRDVKCLVYDRKWQGRGVKPGRWAVASHPRLLPDDREAFAGGLSPQSCVRCNPGQTHVRSFLYSASKHSLRARYPLGVPLWGGSRKNKEPTLPPAWIMGKRWPDWGPWAFRGNLLSSRSWILMACCLFILHEKRRRPRGRVMGRGVWEMLSLAPARSALGPPCS